MHRVDFLNNCIITEIATILYRFLVLLKNNNHAEFESQYNCLPELKHWLNGSYPSQRIQQNVEDVCLSLIVVKNVFV